MIDGTFQHQDSTGGGGLITNGDTQWMTAGAGILHIERPPEAPRRRRWPLPRHPAVGQPAGGGQVGRARATRTSGRPGRAGVVARRRRTGPRDRRRASPATPGRASPTPRWPWPTLTVSPGARCTLPWRSRLQRARSTCSPGEGTVGHRRADRSARGQLAVFGAGDDIVVTAARPPRSRAPPSSTCSCSAVDPSASRSCTYGPFVMNTRAEIAQAFDDFQAGRMGSVPAQHIGR